METKLKKEEKKAREILFHNCENCNLDGYFENFIDLYPTNKNGKFEKELVTKARKYLRSKGYKIATCSMGRVAFYIA